MTANELLDLLLRLTLASSLAILAVLPLRRPLRALSGAGAAWQLWLMVPAAMLAAALPSMQVQPALVPALVGPLRIATLAAPMHALEPFSWSAVLLAAWLASAAVTAILFARAQRSFVASLGPLTPREGIWYAANAAQGPLLLGWRAPRIVVPADFEARYDAFEQVLVIEHERRHAERGDPLANAIIALLRCLFWFNPLFHMAAARCRFDQELACDADVMQRLPGRIKPYAAAMLKTQVGGADALATCHWQSSHPLKERIMNLNQTAPARARRLLGHLFIAGLLCTGAAGTVLARADTAAAGADYEVLMDMEVSLPQAAGAVRTIRMSPRLLVHEGKLFAVRTAQPEASMQGEFWISDAGNESVSVRMKLTSGDKVLGEPSILTRLGDTSAVAIGPDERKETYKVTMTVKRAAKGAPRA